MRNNLLSYIFLPIFLGLVFASLVLTIKPGASIFYYKIRLDPHLIKKDSGFAYRYPVTANPQIFPVDRFILAENKTHLKVETAALVTELGGGIFMITDPSEEVYYLYFAPRDNSDPRTNGHSYTLYLPVIFLSRPMGLVYLSVLLLLTVRFLIYYLRSFTGSDRSPRPALIPFIDNFIRREIRQTLFPAIKLSATPHHRSVAWQRVIEWTIVASFIYIASEWLFFITKPSFFNLIPFREKVEILLQTGFMLAFPATLLVAAFWVNDRLLAHLEKPAIALYLSALIPTVLLASLSLLLVDNFSYTLFSFGIVSSEEHWRVIYTGLFIFGFVYLHRQILKSTGIVGESPPFIPRHRVRYYALNGLLIGSSLFVLARYDFSAAGITLEEPAPGTKTLPNILLLGGDGLNAGNMSIYGYDRLTTPVMEEFAGSFLIAENAFTNSAQSTGSIISMFNSRLPTQTRVLTTTDILRGEDAFQHLPGIVKRAGYYTAQIGVIHYIDAYNMNMRNGFDLVNNQSLAENVYLKYTHSSSLDDSFYFVYLLSGRISERLQHIFFIKQMEHPISEVTGFEDFHRDQQRLNNLLDIITTSEKPFFVQVHMMVTHGAVFYPPVRVHSQGLDQTEEWMVDFYDDAVLSFDATLKTVFDTLGEAGKLDNTIVVIYSDHGQQYSMNVRIPLLIRFPHGEFAGRIHANVQNLDIAPTLLDYLGKPIPDWMVGTSLIAGEMPADRLIFSAALKGDRSEQSFSTPPFYQFGHFNIIQCNRWYEYKVELAEWETGDIQGHTAPCKTGERMLSFEDIQAELLEHLKTNNFDLSSLP